MSTITAQTLLGKANILLNDNDATRWTNTEMLAWLADGQREIVSAKPYHCSKVVITTLVAGARQSLSGYADYNLLLNIKRNISVDGVTAGATVRMADPMILDLLDPNWQYDSQSGTIVHYTFDPATRGIYQVYPPAIAGTLVELTYGYFPADFAGLSSTISVPDVLGTALVDYLCYRALSKDAEFGDIVEKAAAHYKLFTDAVAKS